MRLIECHVENFGKLRDLSVDFTPGYQVFCQPNGWGKSTFAAFLRVMFFGFEGENKRKGIENERKRFWPWQGGTYGGQLTFETNGKRYTVSRVFGDKKGNDIFDLRDADTNLPSDDFSENLGEEIFRINSESFMRTVYIGQNDCVTGSTDSIHAKMGNLTDNMQDLDCYDKAVKTLQDLRNKMSPGRKTGQIYKMNDEITRLQTIVSAGEDLEDSIHRYEEMIARESAALQEKKAQQERVFALQKKVSLLQDRKAKRAAYEQICEDCREKEKAYNIAKERFPGDVPDEEELRSWMRVCDEMDQAVRSMQVYQLTEEEAGLLKAAKGPVENGDIRAHETGGPEQEEEPDFLRKRWESVQEEMDRVSSLISVLHECRNRRNVRSMKQDAFETAKAAVSAEQKKKRANLVCLVPGIILLAAGLVLCTKFLLPGILAAAVGVILILLGINQTLKEQEGRKGTAQQDVILTMQQELQADDDFIEKGYQQVEDYLKNIGVVFQESTALEQLQDRLGLLMEQKSQMEIQWQQYQKCLEKQKNYRIARQRYEMERHSLCKELQKSEIVPSENLKEQLQEIWRDHIILMQAMADYESVLKKKADYEKGSEMEPVQRENIDGKDSEQINQYETNPQEDHLPTLEELNLQLIRIDRDVEDIRSHQKTYRRQLEHLQEEYDEWSENKDKLSRAKESLKQMKVKYRRLQKTQEYLAKAKENMTARYMEPLMNSFSGYYQTMMKKPADRYHMDADTNITVEEQGLQRQTVYFSAGYQDLIGFCLRLALVDAMYQDEKPFLILDDPFANLDDEKAKGGQELLREISEDYQLVYFTCSENRGMY